VIPLKDENPTRRPPVVTLLVIAACAAIYVLWQPSPLDQDVEDVVFTYERAAIPCEIVQGRPLTAAEIQAGFADPSGEGCDVPASESGALQEFPDKSVPLSVLTSMFLHGDLVHLGGNLLFLWIFGNNIEDHLGPVRYLLFYVVAGIVATLAHVALNLDSTIPMVGASGAIAGVMGAYLVWFPNAPVRTVVAFFFITFVRVRAKWVLGFWFVLQFFTSPNSGVAWAAHVGGFVFGVLVALLVKASRAARRALWAGDHLDEPLDGTGGHGYRW
jgi:membrane associated rhomboid family serine protease